MMSRAPRWHDSLVNSKPKKPAPKPGGKEPAAVPASSGGKQAASKTSVTYERSNSLGTRGSETTASDNKAGANKAGVSLKRGSVVHQGPRAASRPGRQALRLCSSRSFSSLQSSSLSAAPFMRSSRSLNRLDQTPTGDDSEHAVKHGPTAAKKPLSYSEEQLRDDEDQFDGDEEEQMKTSSSSELQESPSSASYHTCNKVKKQTIDGVHTLCAITSMRHNWLQAMLKNVRHSSTSDVTSSFSEQKTPLKSQLPDSAEGPERAEHPEPSSSDCAEETQEQQKHQEPSLQPEAERRVTGASSCVEGRAGSTSTTMMSNTESTKEKEKQQTAPLVIELEQTQRELSRLRQLNRNLRDENDLLSNSNSSSEQALVLQRLHKMNHDLRLELEDQKSSFEETREVELRRRVDLLAQQAQLLVTGDATALAQARLEQDRQQFMEQRQEWERCRASLKSQLSASEEQRKEAVSRSTQLQQELQSYHSLEQEAQRLHKHLQEVTTQLQANEEAQAQKEARLQEHLMLLQASQDRERRSLASSLAQAEQLTQELQRRLDMSELEVHSLNKTQTWTRNIEEAQQQLQEELACTVSVVKKLQDEREHLDRRCQELQSQLGEADGEVSRLQSRLKTDETHYYNLEHSFERVSEELQLALGKERQRESELQEIREGYERLLDRKEQELTEVLLKMEVLGNSLEETEVRLNEKLKVCSCGSPQRKDTSSEQQNERSDLLPVNDRRPNVDHAGDDPERFMSVIQVLETKLYLTEEKLREIMQRLEEHQSHIGCQDPHLCSQLTQSRATAQHLSLQLHSQAKQSRRFAQETEGRCRVLGGRFQIALNIIQACRGRLQAAPINITDFDKQLAAAASCIQQGEKDADKLQQESLNACKGGDKILSDETLAGAENNSATFTSEDDIETEVSDGSGVERGVDENGENASAADLRWMQEQAKLIYLSDRLHSDLERQRSEVLQDKLQALCQEQDSTLKDEQEAFHHTLCQLQEDNSALRETLERAEQKIIFIETGNRRLLEDIEKIEEYHEERMKNLESGFQEKIGELQHIHEEEMQNLHGYYIKSSKEKQSRICTESEEAYLKEKHEATCDQGFAAMEEMHRQLISDLQKQHQTEMAALLKQKDKLLQEETTSTMAAIVTMRRAHKVELEKSRQSQHIKESADITQLQNEYEKEFQLMHKELEVLSVQHTQKCLEHSQLSQELQEERQSSIQYQKLNKELKKKQRETDEMSQLHFSLNGKQSQVGPQVNDFYEMEVILRAREAEMQFLRQEARSLKEELKLARMDKIYAQNKLKALHTTSLDEPHQDVTWSNRDASGQSLKDTGTNTSNAAFLKKKDKSSLTRQIRGVRSKSLKEGLSIQERMKLFDH
ncbi:Myosin phosphatase Rho-interacting protein [Dissostichus eleginoides]|uniref:Myosin phosphatase Rho-interacting protein n=1 Tax=Dissostichus eleginoides TaxID=100907 RepID=A0AAD9B8R5_DISEL|nr:Myosin phosphatase Rho-interacting protein [Dissostichus eleginoides]